jgi:hypothetical protein
MWSYFTYFRHGVSVTLAYPLCFGKCSNLPNCIQKCGLIPPVKLKWINWIRLYTLKYSLRTLHAFVTPTYRLQATFYRLCLVKRLSANLTGFQYMSAVNLFSSSAEADLHSRLPIIESMKLDADLHLVLRRFSVSVGSFMSNFTFRDPNLRRVPSIFMLLFCVHKLCSRTVLLNKELRMC